MACTALLKAVASRPDGVCVLIDVERRVQRESAATARQEQIYGDRRPALHRTIMAYLRDRDTQNDVHGSRKYFYLLKLDQFTGNEGASQNPFLRHRVRNWIRERYYALLTIHRASCAVDFLFVLSNQ